MEIMNTLSSLANGVASLAGDTIEIGRLNLKIKDEELKITRIKKDIGTLVYKQYETGISNGEEIAELCEKIKDAEASIEIIKDGLDRVKSQTKTHVNEVMHAGSDSKGCAECGSVEHQSCSCPEKVYEPPVQQTPPADVTPTPEAPYTSPFNSAPGTEESNF